MHTWQLLDIRIEKVANHIAHALPLSRSLPHIQRNLLKYKSIVGQDSQAAQVKNIMVCEKIEGKVHTIVRPRSRADKPWRGTWAGVGPSLRHLFEQ